MKFATKTIDRALGIMLSGLAAISLLSGSIALAEKPNPYTMADETWITISGTVDSVRRDNFTLDYGDGHVIVEMDDGDRDADAYKLMPGDEVTVSGRIDDDFYELTSIEASSVYVKNLGTTFFASAVDEESFNVWTAAEPLKISEVIVYGTVTDVDNHEFTVDSGLRQLRVDVQQMPYDPLDDQGYQKIRVGDRVKVTGEMDVGLFEGRELVADSIIRLNKA